MTNMSIQPLWLTHFIEILLVLEFELTKFIVGVFSYKAHFRPQVSSNVQFHAFFLNFHGPFYFLSHPNMCISAHVENKPFFTYRALHM